MLHNPKRIRLIEKWAKWLALLNLISAIGGFIFFVVIMSTGKLYTMYSIGDPVHLGFWEKTPEITRTIFPTLSTLAQFIFLMGISKATHFLRMYYTRISKGG